MGTVIGSAITRPRERTTTVIHQSDNNAELNRLRSEIDRKDREIERKDREIDRLNRENEQLRNK